MPCVAPCVARLVDIDLEAAKRGRLVEAARAGYQSVEVTDLAAVPDKYNSKKVAFSGFYSGQDLDIFFVYAKFAKGGSVRVDGSKLNAEKRRALLAILDGFHRVFVKGLFHVSAPSAPGKGSVSLGAGISGGVVSMASSASSNVVRADDVMDLGKANTNE